MDAWRTMSVMKIHTRVADVISAGRLWACRVMFRPAGPGNKKRDVQSSAYAAELGYHSRRAFLVPIEKPWHGRGC